MKNFKFTWKNFGMMRVGYDLASFSIEIKESEINPTITFTTGKERGITVIDKTYKLKNKEILEKISKVSIPETNVASDGLDGDAWEVEFDGKVLKGYLDRPKWLEQIKKIIDFKNIYSYVDKKRKIYLGID